MTQTEILRQLSDIDPDQQIRWMIALGWHLTVAARNFYEAGTDRAEGPALRGFNEIQHRVYARIRDTSNGMDWTLESFIQMLIEYAKHYKISSDVAWALKQSLPAPID